MEVKKSPKANLEKGKALSFFMGLVVSLSLVYFALELHSSVAANDLNTEKLDIADMEDAMLVPENNEPEPPEPEQAPQEQIEVALPDEIKVVDDNKEVAKIAIISIDENKVLPPPAPIVTNAPKQEEEPEDKIFEIVEEQPVPPGGSVQELLKWVSKNLQYPEIAADNGVQGKLTVQFVVERDGSVSDIKVVRGVDPSLDKEAVRVLSKMGKWKPGRQRGKAVRSRYTLPVTFKLVQ